MELKEGIMKNKDLAIWFGIKPNSFAHAKDKKLEELKKYADFEMVNGKVNILKVFCFTYVKKGSKNYEFTKKKTRELWASDGLDTCSRVALKINEQYSEDLKLQPSTTYNYVRNSRNDLWGKPSNNPDEIATGEIGSCKYEWCKKIGNTYQAFTEAEHKMFKMILEKSYSDNAEFLFNLNDDLNNKRISKEEYINVMRDNFFEIKAKIEEALGSTIVKATRVKENFE